MRDQERCAIVSSIAGGKAYLQAGTPTWTSPSVSGSAPASRYGHGAAMGSDDKMWIYGGYGSSSSLSRCLQQILATTRMHPILFTLGVTGLSMLVNKNRLNTEGSYTDLHYLDTQARRPAFFPSRLWWLPSDYMLIFERTFWCYLVEILASHRSLQK